MKPALRGISSVFHKASATVNQACILAACSFLVLLLCLVLVQTFSRYALSNPPAWTEEAGRYCMIWAGLLGATAAFRLHEDPRLIAIEKVSRRRIAFVGLIDAVTVLIFCVPLLVASFGYVARQSLRKSETLQINMALVTAIIPIFAAIMILHAVAILTTPAIARTPGNEAD